MPLTPPLDTREHVIMAYVRLCWFHRDEWPRILGAAVGYGIVSHVRARELLMEDAPQWWCHACNCSQPITCNWCGADACASCWRCVTPGCGDDMPKQKPRKLPKVITERREGIRGVVQDPGAGDTVPVAWPATAYYSTDGQNWVPLGEIEDISFSAGSVNVRWGNGSASGVYCTEGAGSMDPGVLASGTGYSRGGIPGRGYPRTVSAWARPGHRRRPDPGA